MKDLFQHVETLPKQVQQIVEELNNKIEVEGEDSQQACSDARNKMRSLGYTFDYGLDGVPYDLVKIKEKRILAINAISFLSQFSNPEAEQAIELLKEHLPDWEHLEEREIEPTFRKPMYMLSGEKACFAYFEEREEWGVDDEWYLSETDRVSEIPEKVEGSLDFLFITKEEYNYINEQLEKLES